MRRLGWYAAVGLVTALLLPLLLDLSHLGVPLQYASDGLSGSAHVKGVLDHGWIAYNGQLGAPEGRHGNDFPGADNLHLLVVALAGLVTDRWPVVLNAYFLLGFPLAAVAAAWFFEVVGVRRSVAGPLAVLYAYAPYHLYRGEIHLYLASYYVVPLAAVVVWRALAGEPLRWRETVPVLVLLGTASSYYSIFCLAFLAVAGGLAFLASRSGRRLLGVVGAMALLMAVMVLNMLPNLLYERSHGANLTALVRSGRLTEFYGLKLTSLLLPIPDHRVQALADLRTRYDADYPLPSEVPTLGLVAAAGLVVLLVALVREVSVAQRRLAVLAFTGFLLGTVGGLSTLFALFVTDSVRGWNRISIYLALFGLASVGLLLQRVRWSAAVAGVVMVVGLLDQVPSHWPGDRAQVVRDWDADAALVASMERQLPDRAMVLQLPYVPYPESPPVLGTGSSDQLRPYLHSTDLRWSFGGVKGRPEADWAAALSGRTPDQVARLAAAAGFDAVLVDRKGYRDAFALPVLVRSDRYTAYDLRGLPRDPEVGEHVVRHPVAYGVDLSTSRPRVALDNPLPSGQTIDVTLTLVSSARPSAVAVRWPDGTEESVAPTGGVLVVTRRLTLPPGRCWVDVSTPADATTPSGLRPSQVRYRLRSASLPDPVLERYLGSPS